MSPMASTQQRELHQGARSMNGHASSKCVAIALFGVFWIAMTQGMASAQGSSGPSMQSPTARLPGVPTNLPGVRSIPAPPADFNPQTASPEALQQYGFPPRPDANLAPGAFAAWRKAVTVPQNRVNPTLEQTEIYHLPLKAAPQGIANPPQGGGPSAIRNVIQINTYNWSGWAVEDAKDPFGVEAIQAVLVVPVARVPFYSCTGSSDYSSQWVGIDGFASSDVLQAGTEADAACGAPPFYSFWYEWYPFSEVRIGYPFTASAGDFVFVEVWNTSSTVGYAYIADFSTQQVVVLNFSAPSGTTLIGDSVEWIVERPGIGGGLAELTNYLDVWMWGDIAWNYASSSPKYYLPGYNPTGLAYQIQMLDDYGYGESYGSLVNYQDLLFENYGSSY